MSAELKPCPFCLASAARMYPPTCDRLTPYDPSHRAFPKVRCQCGVEVAGVDWDTSGRSAIEAWNTRAPVAAQEEVKPTAEQIREWRHKAGQYDTVVTAVQAADGGQYRNDTISALLCRIREAGAAAPDEGEDTRRLNWLETKRVNVLEPFETKNGKLLFYALPGLFDDRKPGASSIRADIDFAMSPAPASPSKEGS